MRSQWPPANRLIFLAEFDALSNQQGPDDPVPLILIADQIDKAVVAIVSRDQLQEDVAAVGAENPRRKRVCVFDMLLDPAGDTADHIPTHTGSTKGGEKANLHDVAELKNWDAITLMAAGTDDRRRVAINSTIGITVSAGPPLEIANGDLGKTASFGHAVDALADKTKGVGGFNHGVLSSRAYTRYLSIGIRSRHQNS